MNDEIKSDNAIIEKEKLLLQTCCAPCACYVVELLSTRFNITAYFFNPNIAPAEEHDRRLAELKRFALDTGLSLIAEDAQSYAACCEAWKGEVSPLALFGERSPRCHACYKFRLEAAFQKAAELNIPIVATSLSISPHKDAAAINKIGRELGKQYGIQFYEGDFKKNDGYKKSVALSKEYGFYRQDYCGCEYSLLEKDKTSAWYKSVMNFKQKNSA